jgi:heptosyltransferase-2
VTPADTDGFLVLRLSSVGDIVLTEPVVAGIRERFPCARIGFVVKRRFTDLVAGNASIDRVHVLDDVRGGLRSLAGELASGEYRHVIDLHDNARTRVLARAAGAAQVLRYRKREPRDAIRVRLLRRSFRASRRLVERYLEAAAPLGVDTTYRAPVFHLRESDEQRARERLAAAGLGDAPMLVVAPGSVWATKRWPAGRFAEVAAGAFDRWGLVTVALGAAAERDLCESVIADAPCAWNAAGLLSLGESAAVIRRGRVFLGNDSGPTHIARALGTPTVAVFGPTDPGQFSFEGHELLYADLACSACSFYGGRRCREGHWDCMLSISSDDALQAVDRSLAREEAPPCASS